MTIIAESGYIFIALAIAFGLFMTWGIGANDVANAMGTSVGSGAISVRQAVVIAAIFEFAGAFLAGGHVTKTIRKGIIDPSLISDEPQLLVFGMLAALLAAGIWLMVASRKGWPVSTTHTIVGAIVGFGLVGIGPDAVNWSKIIQIYQIMQIVWQSPTATSPLHMRPLTKRVRRLSSTTRPSSYRNSWSKITRMCRSMHHKCHLRTTTSPVH